MTPEKPTDNEVFNIARRLDSSEAVSAYLDQVCGVDTARKERISKLVEADRCDSFLEYPPVAISETVEGKSAVEGEGERIGNYKLLQKLGEGGFGVVFMAEQTKPIRRQVALKIIKPGMDTKEVIARFEAERQALAMMDHPNIAKVFDGGQTELGHPYFVMELVKGIPLTQFCDENKLETRARLSLFERVCNAIHHAHQKGIIHRDIKPSNVLVTLHDGTPVPKVIDFGVSKAISRQLTEKTLFTRYGQMIGTPQYMSPEQAEMSGLDIDTRSDIYSLGVLLYELLTGTTPIDPARLRHSGYAEMQRMIREEEPLVPSKRLSTLRDQCTRIASNRGVDLRHLSSAVRGELDWIVMKALEKNRERRYETARGLSLDIDRYLRDEAVLASPPSSLYQIRKFARRHRAVMATAATVGLALMAGCGIATWQAIHAKHSETQARQAEERATVEACRAQEALTNEQRRIREFQRQKYISDMNAATLAYREGDFIRIRRLLDSYDEGKASAGLRKFEWYYLDRICRELEAVPSLRLPAPARLARFSHDGHYVIVAELTGRISVHRTNSITAGNASSNNPETSIKLTDGPHWMYFLRSHPTSPAVAFPVSKSTLVLWNYESGKQLPFEHTDLHGGRIRDVCFSPDGRLLVTGTSTGQLVVWDTESGKRLSELPEHHETVHAVAFSTTGQRFASAGNNGEVAVWDFQSGGIIKSYALERDIVSALTFSPSGDRLALSIGNRIHICDLESDAPPIVLDGHDRGIESLQFLPGGQTLVSGSYDNTMRLWETKNASPLITIRGHSGYVFSVDLSSDGDTLASASKDSSVRIWSLDRLRSHNTLSFPRKSDQNVADSFDWMQSMYFDPSDPSVLIGTWRDGSAEQEVHPFRWDFRKRQLEELSLVSTARGLAVSNMGDIATISRSKGLQLQGPSSNHQLLNRGDVTGTRVAFSPDGRFVAAMKGSEIELLEASNLESRWQSPYRSESPVRSLAFSPDNRALFIGCDDGSLQRVSVETGSMIDSFKRHQGQVLCLAFSPDGRKLASAGYDHKIVVWNCENWNSKPKILLGHTASVRALRFGHKGETLFSGGSDRTIKLWDVATSQVRFTMFTDETIECLDLSPTGITLVSGGRESAIRIWRTSEIE